MLYGAPIPSVGSESGRTAAAAAWKRSTIVGGVFCVFYCAVRAYVARKTGGRHTEGTTGNILRVVISPKKLHYGGKTKKNRQTGTRRRRRRSGRFPGKNTTRRKKVNVLGKTVRASERRGRPDDTPSEDCGGMATTRRVTVVERRKIK